MRSNVYNAHRESCSRTQQARALLLAFGSTPVFAVAKAAADNLDAALVKHAPEVMSYLREHHCRNVGILKFRVKKGNQPVSFKVGPLNDNMVGRLEYALIAREPDAETDRDHPRRQPGRRGQEAASLRQAGRSAHALRAEVPARLGRRQGQSRPIPDRASSRFAPI